jgi:hypothetical protein
MSDTPIVAPPVQQPTIAATPEQVAGLPPEQRASLLNTFRRGGYSQEELSRVFGREAAPAPKLDREQAAQVQYDRSFTGATDPSDYELAGMHGRDASIEDAQAVSQSLRGAFSAMELPKAAAPALSHAIFDAIDQRPANGSPELPAWHAEQQRIVTRVLGGTFEEIMANADHAFRRMDADTRQGLYEAGALDSARVVVLLAQQGARLKQQGK